MSALPSQSYQQQDASMAFPWASSDGAELGGMRDWNGDEGKDVGDARNGYGGTGGHRGGGLLSPAHLGEQSKGIGRSLTVIVLRYSLR